MNPSLSHLPAHGSVWQVTFLCRCIPHSEPILSKLLRYAVAAAQTDENPTIRMNPCCMQIWLFGTGLGRSLHDPIAYGVYSESATYCAAYSCGKLFVKRHAGHGKSGHEPFSFIDLIRLVK